jgi:hypothetical protein
MNCKALEEKIKCVFIMEPYIMNIPSRNEEAC